MENDIVRILELKSEDPLIKSTQKLLRLLAKKETKEKINEQIQIIKQQLDKTTEKGHHRVKEIYDNQKIDEEKLEFALKLINKDKETYEELEKIKKEYRREKIKIDLDEIIKNIENMIEQLNKVSEKLKENEKSEPQKTLIDKIKNKLKKEKQEDTDSIFNDIIEILEKSKKALSHENISENYFIIKDEYYKQQQMKETIDRLYKKCTIKDSKNLNDIINEIIEKANNIIKNIENQIKRINNEPTPLEQYDKRLVEYVYNKQKNYISHSIDHSETNQEYKNILTILKLIKEIEKGNENIVIPEPKKEEKTQERRKIR